MRYEEERLGTVRVLRLAQAAPRGCARPIPGSAPGQAGGTFAQPDLVEAVPAHGMSLEQES